MAKSLPCTVQASLNHVLHQAFYPEGKDHVRYVNILGKQRYEMFLAIADDEEKMISYGNFLWKNELFVRNNRIPPLKTYGPYTMEQIFVMGRCPVWTAQECLEYLAEFEMIKTLSKTKGWEIHSNSMIRSNDFPPDFIRYELLEIVELYPDVCECIGIILVPGVVARNDSNSEGVISLQKDGKYITKIELFPNSWFLLHSCRTAYYENYKPWFLVFVDSMNLKKDIV